MSEFGSGWMAATGGKYQTVVTRITGAVPGWRRVLLADPRRWYVAFAMEGAAGTVGWVMPGPVANVTTPSAGSNLPIDFKYRDAPAALIGEWFSAMGAGAGMMIVEQLYIGE